MYPLEEIEKNLTSIDRQLQYMVYQELVENNRLLRLITNDNNDDGTKLSLESIEDDVDHIKRPELMKRIAKLRNKPQGWNKWETEQMRDFLKGAS